MEENKPKGEVTYSSQDILSSSAAGRNRNFFTRIKGKNHKPTSNPEQHASGRSLIFRFKKISKKTKIIIISICSGVVIIGVSVAVLVLIIAPSLTGQAEEGTRLTNDDGEPIVENIITSVEGIKINSVDAVDKFNQEAGFLTAVDDNAIGLVDTLYQQHLNEATDPNISFELTIGYADFLVGTIGDMEFAESILNGIAEENLSPTQKLELTAAYRYLYRESGNQELYDKYNNQLEEMNDSESVPAKESGEAPSGGNNEEDN